MRIRKCTDSFTVSRRTAFYRRDSRAARLRTQNFEVDQCALLAVPCSRRRATTPTSREKCSTSLIVRTIASREEHISRASGKLDGQEVANTTGRLALVGQGQCSSLDPGANERNRCCFLDQAHYSVLVMHKPCHNWLRTFVRAGLVVRDDDLAPDAGSRLRRRRLVRALSLGVCWRRGRLRCRRDSLGARRYRFALAMKTEIVEPGRGGHARLLY